MILFCFGFFYNYLVSGRRNVPDKLVVITKAYMELHSSILIASTYNGDW